jgi:hypothetical protein
MCRETAFSLLNWAGYLPLETKSFGRGRQEPNVNFRIKEACQLFVLIWHSRYDKTWKYINWWEFIAWIRFIWLREKVFCFLTNDKTDWLLGTLPIIIIIIIVIQSKVYHDGQKPFIFYFDLPDLSIKSNRNVFLWLN